jgi:hypothetical protein
MHGIDSVICVFDVFDLCVLLIDLSMHQSQEKETKPKTQIPLMGMEKLGTKGLLLLHYYNREPIFSLRF